MEMGDHSGHMHVHASMHTHKRTENKTGSNIIWKEGEA